jgi:hypothetical protein
MLRILFCTTSLVCLNPVHAVGPIIAEAKKTLMDVANHIKTQGASEMQNTVEENMPKVIAAATGGGGSSDDGDNSDGGASDDGDSSDGGASDDGSDSSTGASSDGGSDSSDGTSSDDDSGDGS